MWTIYESSVISRCEPLPTDLMQTFQDDTLVNNYQTICTYDASNNILTQSSQIWQNDIWENTSYRLLWTYDENDNCILKEHLTWNAENWQPTHIGSVTYYNNMQSFFRNNVYAYKITVSYKNDFTNTAIADIALSNILVYPNPTTGQINIKTEDQKIQQIAIFDLLGTNLLETIHTTMDISYFSAGMYVVQITTGKGIITRKIVKK